MKILYDGKMRKLKKAMNKGRFVLKETPRPITYVQENGRNHGPYDLGRLRSLIKSGNFSSDDWASFDGQNWVKLAQVPGIFQPITDYMIIERTDFNYKLKKFLTLCGILTAITGSIIYGINLL